MRIDVTILDEEGRPTDVAVHAASGIRWPAVADALAEAGLPVPRFSGTGALTPASAMGDPALSTGAILSDSPRDSGPAEGLTLEVVGGPNAGTVHRLTQHCVVGRATDCDVVLDDPEVSRRHLVVTPRLGRVEVSDESTSTVATVHGRPCGRREWLPGSTIALGSSAIRLGASRGPLSAPPARRITSPVPPAGEVAGGGAVPTLIAAIAPAVGSAAMAWMFAAPQMLMFAALTPLTMAGTSWGSRLGRRRAARQASARHAERVETTAEEVRQACEAEVGYRQSRDADPATLRRTPHPRADPLRLRLGLGTARADLEIDGSSPVLPGVPITIDLRDGPLVLSGPPEQAQGRLRWLLCQVATYAPADDLDIVIVGADRQPAWHWARWLPQLRDSVAPGREAVLLDPAKATMALHSPGASSTVPAPTPAAGAPPDLHPDELSLELAEEIARTLAAREQRTQRTGLPEHCRLLDLLGLAATPDPHAIAALWSGPDEAIRVRVGVTADGVHELDLDRDGPHALIAGTTGSGKSEFLQAFVLGLAATNSPEVVTFVLVDYKGGAAFGDCAGLPHTVGLVTDLTPTLVRRALRSLTAELRRRESVLADAGVPDVAAYRSARLSPAIPRLVIVVDEFAALSTEVPELIDGLIGVTQRGRSLGMHLVLATQRPAGVVSAEIRANTQLRIALRTLSVSDSVDVVDSAAAAGIPPDRPGRAIHRGVETVVFQTAQVTGASRRPDRDAVRVERLDVWRRAGVQQTFDAAEPDSRLLTAAIRDAADLRGLETPRGPWLPDLPPVLPNEALPSPQGAVVAVGLVDLPDQQRQEPLLLDLSAGAAVVVAGGPRSGRTGAAVGLGLAATGLPPPYTVELVGICCSGRSLSALDGLPQTGTVAYLDDGFTAIARLVARVSSAARPRRERGVGTSERSVFIVVLDGWGAFAAASEQHDLGRTSTAFLALFADASAAGITVLVTGDRAALSPRLTSVASLKVVLRFPDPADYAVAGIEQPDGSADLPPGRGVRGSDSAQLQLIDPRVPAGCALAARDLIRVRPLPNVVHAESVTARPGLLCLGAGADDAQLLWLPARTGARLLVAGAPRSGRSTLLAALLRQTEGRNVTVAASAASPLHMAAQRLDVPIVDPMSNPTVINPEHVVVIDDGETYLDTAAFASLSAAIRDPDRTGAVVVAVRADDSLSLLRGLAAEVRRWRTGVLLQPGPTDGELFGLRLSRDQLGGPPGRGFVIGDSAWGAPFADAPTPLQSVS